VWFIRLGITPEFIEPGKFQQNGNYERMHRTLKQETTFPPSTSFPAQQRRLLVFERSSTKCGRTKSLACNGQLRSIDLRAIKFTVLSQKWP
jgi:hypothetical protein